MCAASDHAGGEVKSFLVHHIVPCVVVAARVGGRNKCRYRWGAPCGQAPAAAPKQGKKVLLTSDLESDKDGLCRCCGRAERNQPLSAQL